MVNLVELYHQVLVTLVVGQLLIKQLEKKYHRKLTWKKTWELEENFQGYIIYRSTEIDADKLIMRPKFTQGSEYINKWWKKKAIKRYTKLHTENRLKPEILYYSDILGMTWEQCKDKYLGEVGR